MSAHVGTDSDEDMCNMAWQRLWITVTEATGERLDTVAVAEITYVPQQVDRHLRILHTVVFIGIMCFYTCISKNLIRSITISQPHND